MAVDHANGVGGSIYERSTNLPSGNYTITCWAYLITGSPTLSCIVSRVNATSSPTNYELLGFDNGAGGPLTLFSTTGQTLVRNVNVGEWFFIALRHDGTNVTGHTRYATENTFTTQSRTANVYTPVRFALGTDYFGDPVPDMRTEHWTIYSTDIGEEECLRASFSRMPRLWTNLDSYVSLETTAYNVDHSGNQRTITTSGTAPANAPGAPLPRLIRRASRYSNGGTTPQAQPGSSRAEAQFSRRRRRNGGMDWYLTANEWW